MSWAGARGKVVAVVLVPLRLAPGQCHPCLEDRCDHMPTSTSLPHALLCPVCICVLPDPFFSHISHITCSESPCDCPVQIALHHSHQFPSYYILFCWLACSNIWLHSSMEVVHGQTACLFGLLMNFLCSALCPGPSKFSGNISCTSESGKLDGRCLETHTCSVNPRPLPSLSVTSL